LQINLHPIMSYFLENFILYKDYFLLYYKIIKMLNKKYIYVAIGNGLLGFKRGIDDYNYEFKNSNTEYMYSSKILRGFFGTICYINPGLLFITIPKELYRLEVNIRDMKHHKDSDYYNKLL